MQTKTCTVCNLEKDLSAFYYRKDNGKYRNECKNCLLLKQKIFNTKNQHIIRERKREYYLKNNITLKEKMKRRYVENTEAYKSRFKRYHIDNSEHLTERARQWRIENPERCKMQRRKGNRVRRAKIKNIQEVYTKLDEQYTRGLFNNQCANCGNVENLCIDHHYPLSKGHALSRTNAVLLCTRCNCKKQAKVPEEFYSNNILHKITKLLNKK